MNKKFFKSFLSNRSRVLDKMLHSTVDVFEVELAQTCAILERHDHLVLVLNQECAVLLNVIECQVVVDYEVANAGDIVEFSARATTNSACRHLHA